MKKIAVTGTKGKTTVVNVVASILQAVDQNVLKVDTTGHFVNGERRSTLDESKAVWRLVPSVCPGRYLWEFHANPQLQTNGVAVLECSLGCSGPSGLGYRVHEIGVFLNVFEDHLGSSDRIQSKEDIAKAKAFVFQRIAESGYAVFNADDKLVCETLSEIKPQYDIQKIPCGIDFKYFDVEQHLADGGTAVTYRDKKVIVRTNKGDIEVAAIDNIPWAFGGNFMPSVLNILHAVGSIYAYFDGKMPVNITKVIESVRLDPYGGRLTLLKAESGAMILADYAHEKQSLQEVAKLARTLIDDDGEVIGVVRLAHDRTDSLIEETGHEIAKSFDQFVVYDKIDGHFRKPSNQHSMRFPQVVGRTSEVFASAISQLNPNVTRILREDEAIKYAAKLARPNDVIVVIVNDDIERSVDFIKDAFSAEFV